MPSGPRHRGRGGVNLRHIDVKPRDGSGTLGSTMDIRRIAGSALVLAALVGAGCASSTSAPGHTPPPVGPAFAGTAAGGSASPTAGSTPDATAAAAANATYLFDLSNSGFSAELLLGVRQNTLAISQLTVTNRTGVSVNAVPRIRYLDAQQRTYDAITEPDWRSLYPTDSPGLADGKSAQIRVGFTQPFNPLAVTFCLNLGPQDLGCFTRRGGSTPAVAATP